MKKPSEDLRARALKRHALSNHHHNYWWRDKRTLLWHAFILHRPRRL